MNILFLIPYPLGEAPSQRFRFEQYLTILRNEGYSFRVHTFLNNSNWRQFATPGQVLKKFFIFTKGFIRRVLVLTTLTRYDFVFVHREVLPIGPPVFEWLIIKVFRKRVIYDFDDAIWLTDKQNESSLVRTMKWRGKVRKICKWSYKVSCGNDFLCRYARQYNNHVIYNPTTIDTESLHKPHSVNNHEKEITIGWTGSNSTLKYLKNVETVISQVQSAYPSVRFMVIADEAPHLNLNKVVFKRWNIDTEIEDLLKFDIGIMPLPDDDWAKGKCAFKALQYMALEIPSIASPVGANVSVIDHGIDGFLAGSHEGWRNSLSVLIENKALRDEMGKNGRIKVIEQYSVQSNESRFLSLFT